MPLPSLAEALNGKPLKSKNGYAFISLFNEAIQKRPRRRYHEVERFYKCLHPNCDKSYGALNHLNAHIVAQSHGTKRRASEFKN
ncbi:hypothetical protein K502DRAFT_288060 [Neoconidiobolus thromboides FSU 785]|nr:hypothetical protein K502DRAFT_288060 [Neoconidiobolus thromboides FSU 785]